MEETKQLSFSGALNFFANLKLFLNVDSTKLIYFKSKSTKLQQFNKNVKVFQILIGTQSSLDIENFIIIIYKWNV